MDTDQLPPTRLDPGTEASPPQRRHRPPSHPVSHSNRSMRRGIVVIAAFAGVLTAAAVIIDTVDDDTARSTNTAPLESSGATDDTGRTDAPVGVAVVPTLPAAGVPTPPPPPASAELPEPLAPSPVLDVQEHYSLDPGEDTLTAVFQNQGDAPLEFDLTNDGDGFNAAPAEGEIEPGDWTDVAITVDIPDPVGAGPTPFTQILDVVSNGGSTTLAIDGQVETPGHLVADMVQVALVDYRATVSFTNDGGLELDLTGVEAPGLTLGPVPSSIAAGDTVELELAVCGNDAPLPVKVPHAVQGQSLPLYQLAGWVTLETSENSETTQVTGTTWGFFPPSCEPVDPGPDPVLGN